MAKTTDEGEHAEARDDDQMDDNRRDGLSAVERKIVAAKAFRDALAHGDRDAFQEADTRFGELLSKYYESRSKSSAPTGSARSAKMKPGDI